MDTRLPSIPDCAALRTVDMPHVFGDNFNPPGLNNYLGCVQAALDLTALRSIAFPPLAQGEVALHLCDVLTAVCYIDGEYLTSHREPLTFNWQPDRIQRWTTHGALELHSTTVVPFGHRAALVEIQITNSSAMPAATEFKLALRHGVIKNTEAWSFISPGDFGNTIEVDETRSAVVARSSSGAVMVQGACPAPAKVLPSWLIWDLQLEAGASTTLTFCVALGESYEQALASFDANVSRFSEVAAETTSEWDAEMRAAFTPDNDRFSGHLPVLRTDDQDMLRLYHMALGTVLFARRKTPSSVYGTTWITLGPRFWQTASFLWDTSLTSPLLAQLEPNELKAMIETWIGMDIHQHLATDYLTGKPIGLWYSVNDFAMCRMAFEYLRWTGDHAWLDSVVADKTVYEHLMSYATHWKTLDQHGHGLADYGGIWNLLEAVGTYVHEVASLNAASVWCMRFVASLASQRGDDETAAALQSDADQLREKVTELYIPERGCFNVQLPDGSRQEVGHCYDFGTVLWSIGDELDKDISSGMCDFFVRELQTPAWMRALSIRDIDTTFSIRPDHQWTGAYTAWPSIALSGLFTAGRVSEAREWMTGLAESMRQGPVAQAHLAETAYEPEAGGGARKAPSDAPFINDWCDVSGGAFYEPILTGMFGVRAPVFGELSAAPVDLLPGGARLEGLSFQGVLYDVDATGVKASEVPSQEVAAAGWNPETPP